MRNKEKKIKNAEKLDLIYMAIKVVGPRIYQFASICAVIADEVNPFIDEVNLKPFMVKPNKPNGPVTQASSSQGSKIDTPITQTAPGEELSLAGKLLHEMENCLLELESNAELARSLNKESVNKSMELACLHTSRAVKLIGEIPCQG